MRVLFVENDDSFSWNVVDALPVDRREVCVRPGRALSEELGALAEADVVVVGPGPQDPVRARLVDVVLAAARLAKPLLGICLGHQALGLAYGARLVRVPPVHGKRTTIELGRSRLLRRFHGPEVVMRYHSLALADVRAPLQVIARTQDGTPMAVEHATLPMAGLQFHPDSYGTPRGRQMLADFFEAVT